MKKLLLLFTASVISTASIAQDIDNNDISFTYYQLPLTPLNKSLKNYQAVIVQKFEDVIKQKQEAYNQQVIANEAEYKKATDAHATLQKMMDDQYNKEMIEWNKKPKAEQLLLQAQMPQRKTIPYPVKNEVPAPELPKSFDTQVMAGKYIKLQGFNNTPDNAVKITVNMFGFDYQTPKIQERVVQKAKPATETTAAVPEIKKYFYSVPHKHMMSYKIETPTEGVITEQFVAEFDNYNDYKTAEFDSAKQVERNWMNNKAKILDKMQEDIVVNNLTTINNMINDKYGYSKLTYATLLSVVDEKKGYQDYKEAYVAAENAYKALGNSIDKKDAMPEFNKAIGLWENAMKESQPNNKKARVDGDVTEITILNLIEAYIWKDDYLNAKAYIDKIKTLDPSRKGRRRLERLEQLYKANQTRFEANK